MTSVIGDDGALSAVTLLSAAPNVITQIKNQEADGYQAVQLGWGEISKDKGGKTIAGHAKAANIIPKIMREFRFSGDPDENIKVGEKFSADLFEIGDLVDVT